jgi:tetratricopeptide (TPR) repeat protein
MNYSFGWSAAILGVGFALVQVQAVQAISKTEISKTAQSITVMIQDVQDPKFAGSGVIIKREGQTYTVLTAQHVLDSSNNFRVMAADEKQYPVIQGSIRKFPGVDLALIQFTSTESYSIAKMGNSDKSPLGTASFVAGFPATTEVRSEPSFYFTSGEISANANRPLKDGYAIAYSNPTLPGMSGGPVLNEQGELIGIHGRGESAAVPQNAKLREDIYVLKTEFNYAVPINTFLHLSSQSNIALVFETPSRAVTSEPTADDYFLQGSKKSDSGDYKGAMADFDQALRINPNYAEAYIGRGYAHSLLNDVKGAFADFDQALRINPNDAESYVNRGSAREKLGDIKGAIADYFQSIQINPNKTNSARWYLSVLGIGGTRDKRYITADYNPTIQRYPNNADIYYYRGLTRSHSDDREGAIADYSQAIQMNPNFAEAYNERGTVRSYLGDKKGAISDHIQALQIDPNETNAQNDLSSFHYYYKSDKKGVIADYSQALQLFPKSADVYFYRGISLSWLGDKKGSITDYNQAIKINPNHAKAYNVRGFTRNELGDKKSAIADYNQAIKINPEFSEAYNNRGSVRYELGDKKGAIDDSTKAIRIDPKFSEAYTNRGRARYELGDKKGAIDDSTKAIELYSNSVEDYLNRGKARRDLGDNKGALSDFQIAATKYKIMGDKTRNYKRVVKDFLKVSY